MVLDRLALATSDLYEVRDRLGLISTNECSQDLHRVLEKMCVVMGDILAYLKDHQNLR